MISKLKRYLAPDPDATARQARAECLAIIDAAIDECAAIECWNYTAKRIRDQITALDHIGKVS